jgi:hypothetical protein
MNDAQQTSRGRSVIANISFTAAAVYAVLVVGQQWDRERSCRIVLFLLARSPSYVAWTCKAV